MNRIGHAAKPMINISAHQTTTASSGLVLIGQSRLNRSLNVPPLVWMARSVSDIMKPVGAGLDWVGFQATRPISVVSSGLNVTADASVVVTLPSTPASKLGVYLSFFLNRKTVDRKSTRLNSSHAN